MNKFLRYSLIAAPILVGGYFVYKQLNPKKKKETALPPPPPTGGGMPSGGTKTGGEVDKQKTAISEFPLRLGSRGAKVRELQQAIVDNASPDIVKLLGNNPTDGKFGTGTEKAVVKLLGKTSVDNQSDIDKIKKMKRAKQVTETRASIAQKQIDLFKAGKGDFYAIQDTQVASGKITSDGRDINRVIKVYKGGEKLPISKLARFMNNDGFIRAEKGISETEQVFNEWSAYGTQVK